MPYPPGTDFGGLQATLGTLRLGVVDELGVAWILSTLDGWDSPDVRSEYTDREADHGAWGSPVYLGARPITLTGTVEAPDRAALQAAGEQLRAACGLTDTVLTVWETAPKQSTVRRSGRLLWQYSTDRVATFSAMVTAPDPRRYSTTLRSETAGLPSTSGGLTAPVTPPFTIAATTVSGNITAVNEGNFPTRPVFVVAGPVVQPRITVLYPDGTVCLLAYSGTLASGDQLVIDTDAHTAVLNGTASRRRYLSGQWPEIPADGSVSVQFRAASYDASASLTAQWRSAWI